MNSSASGWLDVVKNQVEKLRFGSIQIVVHNSQVVQIETTQKLRFDSAKDKNFSADPAREA